MDDPRVASHCPVSVKAGLSGLSGLALGVRRVAIGRILAPLPLFFAACGLRTPLLDATPAGATPATNDQSAWDGGLLPSTPGQIRCGSITCGYGYQCCVRTFGNPASDGCDDRAKSACRHDEYVRTCDEAADCYPGERCCWLVQGGPAFVSYCTSAAEPSCATGDTVACGSDDDCRAAGAPSCVAQRCRGDILQSCGALPSQYCPP
jgi:hypothetical protein